MKYLLLLLCFSAQAATPTRFNDVVIKNALSISSTGSVASTAAVLDVKSTTKGFSPPRMTSTQRDAIAGPFKGLTIYNTTTDAYNIYNGAWVAVPVAPIAITSGGTGQTTKTAGFDALQPMTSVGDLIVGSTGGSGVRLGPGSSGQILQSNGASVLPSWITSSAATAPRSELFFYGFAGYGSGATNTLYFTTSVTGSQGDLTFSNSSTNGLSVTVGSNGLYSVALTHGSGGSLAEGVCVTKNFSSSTACSSISSTSTPSRLCFQYIPSVAGGAISIPSCSSTILLSSGDVVRPYSENSDTPADASWDQFRVTKVNN